MNRAHPTLPTRPNRLGGWLLLAALVLTAAIYWPGLSGGWLFDDYPNIVDNHGVQPSHADVATLVNAALSSPSSDFKRPLSSLTFAANYLATGLNPFWMKVTNVVIHLLNGWLIFLLSYALLSITPTAEQTCRKHNRIVAALIATGWLVLPINLTAVLYVVQRMESLANIFVLLGLLGYVAGRRHMLAGAALNLPNKKTGWSGFWLCAASVTIPVLLGLLAKETAVMLPLYALLIEWTMLGFRKTPIDKSLYLVNEKKNTARYAKDWRLLSFFVLLLALPLIIGLAWLLPGLLKPENWATRDFTLATRLLSESRIVMDYIQWTLTPTPNALSFYHDDFLISTSLLSPWTTLASILSIAALVVLTIRLRARYPMLSLGISLFLGCHLLTGTILPLELIYEHRNYFASFGLLLALIPILAAAPAATARGQSMVKERAERSLPFALPRYVLLGGLLICWAALTLITAVAWGDPLRLAEDLADRAPHSPRAQYELGRTYIIYSHYDPTSPFTRLAYAPLERAAALPGSSILPEQALIFMNSRMHLPLSDAWWDSMIDKLKARKSTVQDESSLAALVQCAREDHCALPEKRMSAAFEAALSHPNPSARLMAVYGDYAWNVLGNRALGLSMVANAAKSSPNEPAYCITLMRMLIASGQIERALAILPELEHMNIGGRLNSSIADLKALLPDDPKRRSSSR